MSALGWPKRWRCGILPVWPGPGSLEGGEGGAVGQKQEQVSQAWESRDAQLWFENLEVLTEVAVVCPAPALLVETGN